MRCMIAGLATLTAMGFVLASFPLFATGGRFEAYLAGVAQVAGMWLGLLAGGMWDKELDRGRHDD